MNDERRENLRKFVRINLYGITLEEFQNKGIHFETMINRIGCSRYWVGEGSEVDDTEDIDTNPNDTLPLSTTILETNYPRCSTPISSQMKPNFKLCPSNMFSVIESDCNGRLNFQNELVPDDNENDRSSSSQGSETKMECVDELSPDASENMHTAVSILPVPVKKTKTIEKSLEDMIERVETPEYSDERGESGRKSAKQKMYNDENQAITRKSMSCPIIRYNTVTPSFSQEVKRLSRSTSTKESQNGVSNVSKSMKSNILSESSESPLPLSTTIMETNYPRCSTPIYLQMKPNFKLCPSNMFSVIESGCNDRLDFQNEPVPVNDKSGRSSSFQDSDAKMDCLNEFVPVASESLQTSINVSSVSEIETNTIEKLLEDVIRRVESNEYFDERRGSGRKSAEQRLSTVENQEMTRKSISCPIIHYDTAIPSLSLEVNQLSRFQSPEMSQNGVSNCSNNSKSMKSDFLSKFPKSQSGCSPIRQEIDEMVNLPLPICDVSSVNKNETDNDSTVVYEELKPVRCGSDYFREEGSGSFQMADSDTFPINSNYEEFEHLSSRMVNDSHCYDGTFNDESIEIKNDVMDNVDENSMDLNESTMLMCFQKSFEKFHNNKIDSSHVIWCQFENCQKKYKWKPRNGRSRLIDHSLSHMIENHISCTICEFKTKTSRKMQCHYRTHHKDEEISEVVVSPRSICLPIESLEFREIWKKCYKDCLPLLGYPYRGKMSEKFRTSRKYIKKRGEVKYKRIP